MQLINSISNDHQKLLRYFNGTTIFMLFTELSALLTTFAVFPTRATLYLNDSKVSIIKSALLLGISFLLNCHKLPDIFE